MNVKRMRKKVKSTVAFIAGVIASVGSSYVYRLTKMHFELDVPSFAEKVIFLMMLLPLGFGMAYFLKTFKKT